MTFVPGVSGNPAGRPPGEPNKATSMARQAITAFVEQNTPRLNRLLDKIEAENPKAAFDAIMSVVEYNLPKLARSEIENKMSVSFEPLVIQRLAAQEAAPVIDVTPAPIQGATQDVVIEANTTSSKAT